MAATRDGSVEQQPPARLTAERASFRLLVLGFVRQYWKEMDESPSYGEIAAGLQSNRTRVRHAVRSLVTDKKLIRRPGTRGLMLPSAQDKAIRHLEELGFEVDTREKRIRRRERAVTNPPLLPPAALTYPTRHGTQGEDRDRG